MPEKFSTLLHRFHSFYCRFLQLLNILLQLLHTYFPLNLPLHFTIFVELKSRLFQSHLVADLSGLMNNDPRSLAEWNKKMSGGEPIAPEYQETMERMERGDMPAGPPPAEQPPAE